MSNVTPLFAMPSDTRLKPAGFDEFWAVYPRRKDKLDAMRAWTKALKIATAEEIIEGAKRYARVAVEPYVKLPATFLNKGSWLDEEPAQAGEYNGQELMRQSMLEKAAAGNQFAIDWLRRNS